ncbi:MAG: SDR family NAD(P)-dependent oxidoreductase [Acidimicrobiia bacterium]
MGALSGRVAIITGAGRGIGRQHALLFAAEGASVVVNDIGATDAGGTDASIAHAVVDEIVAGGGQAVASTADVADWDAGRTLVEIAVESFGRLDVLVNNAGVVHDRAIVTMDEEAWDAVLRVNLKGHVVPTHWAAAHWRQESKASRAVAASIVHTSSTSGLLGNPGQSNYGAAKAGISTLSTICARELARYGVRSNCVVPATARTRLTEAVPGISDVIQPPGEGFDPWDPANVSPVVGYLATADCPLNGETLFVQGGTVRAMQPWRFGPAADRDGRWTIDDLAAKVPGLIQ